MKRRDISELLDHDLGSEREIADSLADLRRINRWFGGVSTGEALLSRVVAKYPSSQLRIAEVGGATGDTPSALRRRFAQRGIALHYTIVDLNPSHLNGHFPSVAGDAVALPFSDTSFDVVSSSLLIHHFRPDEIVLHLREALRVTRLAVVVNDLRRAYTHLGLVYSGTPLYRSRLTRHDAPASVRRAYTPTELRNIIAANFSNSFEISTHYLFRMGLLLWK